MRSPPDSPSPSIRGLPRGIAPLGIRNYALLWLGFAFSRFGRSVEETGAVWLLYDLTGSPVELGLLGLARAVPSFVLSPIAGVVADRVDQRRILIVTQAAALVSSLTLGLLVLFDAIEPWFIYVEVALQAGIMSFDAGARQALFPRLVPRTMIAEAVTLNSTAGRAAQLIGPLVGGIAIAALGVAAPFLLNAVTYLALIGAVAAMKGVPSQAARAISTFRGDLADGMRYILRAPVLSGLLMLELVFGIFQVNAVIITIVAREVLEVGPEGLGGLLAAPALGALIAIAWLIVVGPAMRQGRFAILSTIAYAGALVIFAMSESFALSFAVLAATGLLDALVTITRHSVMQLAAPSEMRGRVMANMGTITRGISPLAETQSGLLTGALGPRVGILVSAVALGLAAVTSGRANPKLWRFTRDDLPDEPTRSSGPHVG